MIPAFDRESERPSPDSKIAVPPVLRLPSFLPSFAIRLKSGRASGRGHAVSLVLVLSLSRSLSLISAARSVGRLLAMRVGGPRRHRRRRRCHWTESHPSLFVRTRGKGGLGLGASVRPSFDGVHRAD